MTMYSTEPDSFDDLDVIDGLAVAAHAAITLS